MNAQLAVILGLWFLAGAAAAEPNIEAGARCAKLTNSTARLACFDTVFDVPKAVKKVAESVPVVRTTNTDHWDVRETVSSLDDSKKVTLTTDALGPNMGRFGREIRLTLLAACRENTTNVWIHFGGHFMSDYQHGTVTYRIDKNKPRKKKFRESNNNEALGLWSGRTAIPFLKDLLGHETLLVRASPHSENALEATFDISGLELAIVPLREACGW